MRVHVPGQPGPCLQEEQLSRFRVGDVVLSVINYEARLGQTTGQLAVKPPTWVAKSSPHKNAAAYRGLTFVPSLTKTKAERSMKTE